MKTEINECTLSLIDQSAKSIGYREAVKKHLDLPSFDVGLLKERALYYFIKIPTSFSDQYLLLRAWIKAYEELMNQSGICVSFSFPHIDHFIKNSPES